MVPFRVLTEGDIGPIFTEEQLKGYTKDRPGVLESIDIFQPGPRSENHHSWFSLFKERDDAKVLVFPYYLELFEYVGVGHMLLMKLAQVCYTYPDNIIVAQWNHDIDIAKAYPELYSIPNLRILNFNTSVRHPQDIVLPFWTIDESIIERTKLYRHGFIGAITHPVRQQLWLALPELVQSVVGNDLSPERYREAISSFEFSYCPRGAGLGSYRFFECFHMNTIPVLIADEVVLPYEDLDYNKICIRIPENKAGDVEYIKSVTDGVNVKEYLENIKSIRYRFTLAGVQEEVHRCLLNL